MTNPLDGSVASAVEGLGTKSLVIVLPQLGDFDTAEYVEQLLACESEMQAADLDWRIISIGDAGSAKRFAQFTSLPLERIRVCEDDRLHSSLGLACGPNWDLPGWCPETVFGLDSRAWLNYMAMCAGLASPGTLQEIFRGYVGDKDAPERLAADAQVRAGPITITGTRRVTIGEGLIDYENLWKDEQGYQRPVELATVRLRNMVEVLSNWKEYVPDDRFLAWRGATFVFDGEDLDYEHVTPGVLTYSATPSRPLAFLEERIGKKALNPLGLADPSGGGGEH